MNVSFYLKHPGAKGANESTEAAKPLPVYARICYQRNDFKFYISESILPQYWDRYEQRAKQTKKFPIYPEFNARLDNIARDIKKIALQHANDNGNKYPTPEALKGLLKKAFRLSAEPVKINFLTFFAGFIERSKNGTRTNTRGKPITAGTVKNYGTTKACLERYIKHTRRRVDFDCVDMVFYNDFRDYLVKVENATTNYIGKHIKILKTVLSDAENNFSIPVTQAYKSRNFSTPTEQADTIYLTETELKALANLDLSGSPGHDRTRDLFLIGCHTGLRYSDLSRLRPEHINEGLITISAQKTGATVVIPVHDVVSKIMSKYGGQLPKALSNQKTNVAIKEVCRTVDLLKAPVNISRTKGGKTEKSTLPKCEHVSTHTARRSFCTNAYLSGIPTISIMAISGHKTESAFMKYIRVASEEHAQIIKKVWSDKVITDSKNNANESKKKRGAKTANKKESAVSGRRQ